MKNGFIKVAACDIRIKIADTKYNTEKIKDAIDRAERIGVNVITFPELCITGYSCGDLFFSQKLIDSALMALMDLRQYTTGKNAVVIVGLPLVYNCKLYNCAAVLQNGKILGIATKTCLPNHGEFCEKRYFAAFDEIKSQNISFGNFEVPFGNNLVFCHKDLSSYTFGIEICRDLWSPNSPAQWLATAGANIIFNPSASNEVAGKADYRRLLVQSSSAKLECGYVFASAGCYESTQDTVFSAHHIICEKGNILAESLPFANGDMAVTEIDTEYIVSRRIKNTNFKNDDNGLCRYIKFNQNIRENSITRKIEKMPFVPEDNKELMQRAEDILKIQSYGLARRLEHTGAKKCVIGISGGLDSTLALLVAVRAMDILDRPRQDILAITMPCFGTTKRTRTNSELLCNALGVDFQEINIERAVTQHFLDIGQDREVYDVTYENSQARERTQVLMDVANKTGGIVVGTGDLSELALGWATYNGDHMSMYGVNSGVPKTLIRYIVAYEASISEKPLSSVLMDILDTPVSPELLPADESGNISQKTEDLVGPYELHDFFLYQMLGRGANPQKIFRLANIAFGDEYTKETIKNWLKVFIKRFFAQQFKRSCLPDGPKVCEISLSPRGDFSMPSDAVPRVWLDEVDDL